MRSGSFKTLVLAALLGLCAAAAAEPQGRESAQSGAAVLGDGSRETVETDDGARYQSLSTLGALALGVLGLLWVRRHTAEL